MKKIITLAILAISSLACFSQSVRMTDLMTVYNSPYKEISSFLTKEKKYKAFKQETPPEFTVYHYFLNRGKANEEEVITGLGFEIEPGKINTNLYYKSRDSSFVDSLQNQVADLGLKLDREQSTSELRSFDYSNSRIEIKFTYSSSKNYMIFFSRKR